MKNVLIISGLLTICTAIAGIRGASPIPPSPETAQRAVSLPRDEVLETGSVVTLPEMRLVAFRAIGGPGTTKVRAERKSPQRLRIRERTLLAGYRARSSTPSRVREITWE